MFSSYLFESNNFRCVYKMSVGSGFYLFYLDLVTSINVVPPKMGSLNRDESFMSCGCLDAVDHHR